VTNASAGSINNQSSSSEKLLQLIHQSQLQQHQLVEAIGLPKTELMMFNGDPLKYWLFVRSFDKKCRQSINRL
jgi:general stress protein 26